MKTFTYALAAICLITSGLSAQWISREYTFVEGWNGLWLAGDASHTTVAEIFADSPEVTEVWRWNPNPDQILFTTAPSEPSTSSDEWTVWKRNDVNEQGLTKMVGNSSYLIRSASASTVTIKQLVLPPAATWLISGANFLGFPSAGSDTSAAPTFNAYFASFPSASTTVLAPGAAIYRYIGGELSSSNPMQIDPATEPLNARAAYWFQIPTVSDFTAAIEYEVPSTAGLAFGRTLSAMTVGVMNRSTTDMVLTISLEDSAPAPVGQREVAGGVALTRRIFNSETNAYDEVPVDAAGFTITIPASGRANLDFGINRTELTDTSASYASLLRITDSGGLTDVLLPVSAEAATPAGLWAAQVSVDQVVSTVPGADGTTTSQPFPLRFLIHVDAEDNARLLSQAFLGRLVASGNPLGIAVAEESVLAYGESEIDPQRYLACQLPLGLPILGQGTVDTGSTVTWEIQIPYNDPTNPFVHTYHPDHDNLDASFSIPLESGDESYDIKRVCAFTFTSSPPDESTILGWGTTILGGTYAETITGINSQPLTVRGTFTMGRISEIADIDLTQSSN